MKKFLSLVLALVMAMSLVTISAGATEYKDLTDKDEIQYEEAVAVLNRIGIITGYTDGSFQPKKELTRGAAAKIIVSLMIGSEAASNLTATSAPYSDVPVSHTFAGVISYCKTSGYINGYSDGTFKPEGTLSGYAFSKMLLGALGYNGDLEGFTGTGWTMNVARLGNEAGLFDRLHFKGNETVNREQACQLALNTLKATLVEYSGGFNVTAGDASVTGGQVRSYKTSNQDFATNIDNEKGNQSDWWTVQFGEEHFVDLKLLHSEKKPIDNDLGQPCAEWSYKKVTIGKFPLTPDYSYNTLMEHNVTGVTAAAKLRALGLSGKKISTDPGSETQLWLNGVQYDFDDTSAPVWQDGNVTTPDVANIADLTDNGTVVEVYVSNNVADLITDVVVIQTQMMEVKRVASDYVALATVSADNDGFNDDDDRDTDHLLLQNGGFNVDPIVVNVEDVESDHDYYEFLNGLKVDDLVAVVPVATSHDSDGEYKVFKAYTPETVEGKLTKATTYGKSSANRMTVAVTVGGTEYKVADWNKDLVGIDADSIKYTREDVKLFLDEFGNALRAKNVGETSSFIVIKDSYQSLENGKLIYYIEGWDIKGNELTLNVGRTDYLNTEGKRPGDVVFYTNKGATGEADWVLKDFDDAYDAKSDRVSNVKVDGGNEIKASNNKITMANGDALWITNSIKFIYVTVTDNEVESVYVKTGVQATDNTTLNQFLTTSRGNSQKAQACINDDGEIEAIVIKTESNDAISTSLLYIRDVDGDYSIDASGKKIYGYTVAMMNADGTLTEKTHIHTNKDLDIGDFASYTKTTHEEYEDYYTVREHTDIRKTTSVLSATVLRVTNKDKGIVRLTDLDPAKANIAIDQTSSLTSNDVLYETRMAGARWLDLTRSGISKVGDLKDFIEGKPSKCNGIPWYPTVQVIINDDPTKDAFRDVALVIITGFEMTATDNTSSPGVDPDEYILELPTDEGGTLEIPVTGGAGDNSGSNWDASIAKVPAGRAAGDLEGGENRISAGDTVKITLTQKAAAATIDDAALQADAGLKAGFKITGLPTGTAITPAIATQGVAGDDGTPEVGEWKAVTYTAESFKKGGTEVAKESVKVFTADADSGINSPEDVTSENSDAITAIDESTDLTTATLCVWDADQSKYVNVTYTAATYKNADDEDVETSAIKHYKGDAIETDKTNKDSENFEALGGNTTNLYTWVKTSDGTPGSAGTPAVVTITFTMPERDVNITGVVIPDLTPAAPPAG